MGSTVFETVLFAMSRRISKKQPPDSVFIFYFWVCPMLMLFLLECLLSKKKPLKFLFFEKLKRDARLISYEINDNAHDTFMQT